MKNTYIYFRDDFTQAQFEFNPHDPTCLDAVGYGYIGRVLHYFEQQYPYQALTVYVTGWTVHRLPSYGLNTIVFIMQDEWSREPRYRDKVGAVFHACGAKPMNLQALGYGTALENGVNVLHYCRNVLKRDGLYGRLVSLSKKIAGKHLAPVYEFPLGYHANESVEFVPFHQRIYLLSFAGSIEHRVAQRTVPRPKELARSRMVQALTDLVRLRPDLNVHLKTTQNFKDSINQTESYNQTMMQSKFCLIPRGANLETFRYYEAIRYGCIPIVEAFPKLPFYKGAPLIKLDRWSSLEATLSELVQNPAALEQMHTEVLKWWNENCSELQIAKAILGHFHENKVTYGQ